MPRESMSLWMREDGTTCWLTPRENNFLVRCEEKDGRDYHYCYKRITIYYGINEDIWSEPFWDGENRVQFHLSYHHSYGGYMITIHQLDVGLGHYLEKSRDDGLIFGLGKEFEPEFYNQYVLFKNKTKAKKFLDALVV